MKKQWSGSQHPADPDNYWQDDETNAAVCAWCANRGAEVASVIHEAECRNPNKGEGR